MIQYTIEDIKRMLLRCISEYSCEAELLIKFAENENEYAALSAEIKQGRKYGLIQN